MPYRMRRTLTVALTLAVLGSLSFYVRERQSHATSARPSSISANTQTTSNSTASSSTSTQQRFNKGSFTGNTAETPYGTVQITLVTSGDNITDVIFDQMPSDLPHSAELSAYSEPLLKDTTLQNQNATVDFISGATSTSFGYQESLQSALDKAVNKNYTGSNSPTKSTNSTTNPLSNPSRQGTNAPNVEDDGFDR